MTRPDPGAWVRTRRTAVGLTQAQLARLLGLNSQTVSDLECGRQRVTQTMHAAIERVTGDQSIREPWSEAREVELAQSGELVDEWWSGPGDPVERRYRGVDPASGQEWEVVLVDTREPGET